MILSSCFSLTYLAAAVAVAQPPQLETMVVTATHDERPWLTTPAAATARTTESQLPGLRIDSAEVLQGLPGLQVDSRSNFAQDTRLVLRGFGARSAFGIRGMDVRLDNIPLAMPDGQAQLGSVSLDEVESVEVLRGPLASLYGNSAGGVVLLSTRTPEANEARFGVSAGSYDSQRQHLSGTWRSGAWGARVQANHMRSDGFREHSAVERYQGGAQLYYDNSEGLGATLRIDMSRDPETQDPSGLSPEQWREDPRQVDPVAIEFNTRKPLDHRQVSLNVKQQVEKGEWQLALWRGEREVKQWLGFQGGWATSSGGVIDLERDFSGIEGKYRHEATMNGTRLAATLGASLERMEDKRRGYVNEFGETGELRRDETGTVESNDLFTLIEWQAAEALSILGGARYSRNNFDVDDAYIVAGVNPDDSGSVKFNQSSAALGANYQFAPNWAAFASVGRGFETPTLTEMAYRNEGTGLNTELEASRNTQLEAGVRFSTAMNRQWGATLFNVDSDNELVVDQSQGGRTTYHNAAATQRYGVELEGVWEIRPALQLQGSATWLDAQYSAGEWEGNQLPGVAKSQAYAQLRWHPWLGSPLAVSVASRYRSSVATSDANDIEAPGYVTYDMALAADKAWGQYQLGMWLRLENLTDKTYVGSVIVNQGNGRSFEPAPGRTLMAGLELKI